MYHGTCVAPVEWSHSEGGHKEERCACGDAKFMEGCFEGALLVMERWMRGNIAGVVSSNTNTTLLFSQLIL